MISLSCRIVIEEAPEPLDVQLPEQAQEEPVTNPQDFASATPEPGKPRCISLLYFVFFYHYGWSLGLCVHLVY